MDRRDARAIRGPLMGEEDTEGRKTRRTTLPGPLRFQGCQAHSCPLLIWVHRALLASHHYLYFLGGEKEAQSGTYQKAARSDCIQIRTQARSSDPEYVL